ncbi:MAG: PAS domain S-box protein [Zetaproteobacteria bacterium]|nr:PAS domain S-box protein [Zetaproteobacteria bacterium]
MHAGWFDQRTYSLKTIWLMFLGIVFLLPSSLGAIWVYQHFSDKVLDEVLMREKIFHHRIVDVLNEESRRMVSQLQSHAERLSFGLDSGSSFEALRWKIRDWTGSEPSMIKLYIYRTDTQTMEILAEHGFSQVVKGSSPAVIVPQHGRLFVGTPYVEEDGHYHFVLSVPLTPAKVGEQRDVLIAVYDIARLQKYVLHQLERSRREEHNATDFFWVDNRGTLLFDAGDYSHGAMMTHLPIVRRLLAEEQWYTKEQYQGVERGAVYGVASHAEPLQWGIISEVSVQKIEDLVDQELYPVVAILALVMLMMTLVGIWALRKMLQPVYHLMQASNKMASGEFQVEMYGSHIAELHQLEIDFVRMSAMVAMRDQQLEKERDQLILANEYMDTVFDAMSDAVFVVDKKMAINGLNRYASRRFGYAEDQLQGKSIISLLEGETSTEVLFRSSSFVDLSRHLQTVIDSKEHDFWRLLDHAHLACMVVNEQGDIIYSNAMLGERLGYRSRELLGKGVEVLLPASMRKSHVCFREQFMLESKGRVMGRMDSPLSACHKTGLSLDVCVGLSKLVMGRREFVLSTLYFPEIDPDWFLIQLTEFGALFFEEKPVVDLMMVTEDQSRVPVLISPSLIYKNGEIDGAVLIAKDVTDQKKAIDRARMLAADAAYKSGVAEISTTVLHNIGNAVNNLSHRIQSLEEVSPELENLSVILDGLALRMQALQEASMPLSQQLWGQQWQQDLMVLTRLPQVLRDMADSDVRVNLSDIAHHVDHIKEIIQAQQSMMAGEKVYMEALDMAAVVEECLQFNALSLRKRNITVLLRNELAHPIVLELPKVALLQAFGNLVKNGWEAIETRSDWGSEECTGKMRVHLRLLANPRRLEVEFVDNGVGIEAERLTKIFSFGESDKLRGSGFGLHSVALFCQSIHAHVEARSEGLGFGTSMVIQFPLEG